jgi:hypothetical protein
MYELSDNVQHIVDRNNVQDIVDTQLRKYVPSDSVIQVEWLITFDICILQPGPYPGKALVFVL